MMPAQRAPGLDHKETAARRMAVQRQRDQPARQPAADDHDVMGCGALRGGILGGISQLVLP